MVFVVVAAVVMVLGVLTGIYLSGNDNARLTRENASLKAENRKLRSGLTKVITGGDPVLEAQITLDDLK